MLPFGSVPGYSPLCLDANDPDTVACAFRTRLLRAVPKADANLLLEFKSYVERYVAQHYKPVRRMEFEEWLATTSYNEQRKEQLRAAFLKLNGGRPSRSTCKKVKAFVKSEYYVAWKNARMINSRHDQFKAWSGPMFKAIEEEVYKDKHFIKKVAMCDRAGMIRELRKAGMRFFVSDFTAFESHFDALFMQCCELVLYKWCLQNYPDDAEFLCSVIGGKNLMSTRSGIRASVVARRMSGDMCTSLGNGFSNLMLAGFLAERKGCTLNGFVEGDDGIFALEKELAVDDYAKLGFTIKLEEVDDPCTASFCGLIFPESGEIVRDPRRFLQGFAWTQSFIDAGPKIMNELLKAKALSALCESPQCPVVGALARATLKRTATYNARFVEDGYHHMTTNPDTVSPFKPDLSTRMLFAAKFGVSVDSQLEIERLINKGDMRGVSLLLPANPDVQQYTRDYVMVA